MKPINSQHWYQFSFSGLLAVVTIALVGLTLDHWGNRLLAIAGAFVTLSALLPAIIDLPEPWRWWTRLLLLLAGVAC